MKLPDMRSILITGQRIRSGWRIIIFLIFTFPPLYYLTYLFWEEYLLRYLIIFCLLLVISLLSAKYLDRRPGATIGFHTYPGGTKDYLLGVLLGFMLVSVLFFLFLVLGYLEFSFREVTPELLKNIFLIALLSTVLQSAFEELFFRGYVFQNLMQGINVFSAVLITSLVFGMGHLLTPNSSWIVSINLSMFGVMHALCYVRTKSLFLPSGLHFGWNFFMRNIYSLPVSGTATSSALLDVTEKGPVRITGGEYGPEAGIPALLLMILCTIWIGRSKKLKVSPVILRLWKQYS